MIGEALKMGTVPPVRPEKTMFQNHRPGYFYACKACAERVKLNELWNKSIKLITRCTGCEKELIAIEILSDKITKAELRKKKAGPGIRTGHPVFDPYAADRRG